jgi:hypothetical protein
MTKKANDTAKTAERVNWVPKSFCNEYMIVGTDATMLNVTPTIIQRVKVP